MDNRSHRVPSSNTSSHDAIPESSEEEEGETPRQQPQQLHLHSQQHNPTTSSLYTQSQPPTSPPSPTTYRSSPRIIAQSPRLTPEVLRRVPSSTNTRPPRRRSNTNTTNKTSNKSTNNPENRPTLSGNRRLSKRMASKSGGAGGYFSTDDDESEVEGARIMNSSTASNNNTSTRRRVTRQSSQRGGFPAPPPPATSIDQALFPNLSRRTSHAILRSHPSSSDEDDIMTKSHIERDDDDDDDEGTIRDRDSTDDYDSDGTEGSFTLKDKQQAINETHPFGIRLWKPALYQKIRSVQRTAEGDVHSPVGLSISWTMTLGDVIWALLFGWWMSIVFLIAALICALPWYMGGRHYGRILFGLARYIFYPFKNFVELRKDERYEEEDQGVGRSLSEYQRHFQDMENGTNSNVFESYQPYDPDSSDEDASLLGGGHINDRGRKRRLFGRGKWSLGRIVFFGIFYLVVAPILLFASFVCFLFVFTMPMAKVNYVLFTHLRRHPLALAFRSDIQAYLDQRDEGGPSPTVLICTYKAFGLKYYKYTVGGINVFFVNLMFVVFFTIVDYYLIGRISTSTIAHPGVVFVLALASIIPLAYFIGMAVASISAQSSMGVGATINALFSSVVEIFLYCVALSQGKGKLTEGSIVGSILGGIVLMPGLSMCAGALKRKTQRFNAKSAGVTSTMLLFAVIAAFAPTLFYEIYGTYEMRCFDCDDFDPDTCQRCFFDQYAATKDPFFLESVRPFAFTCAVFLILSYLVGLWFTLRTHAAQIWTIVPAANTASAAATSNMQSTHPGSSAQTNYGDAQSQPSRMVTSSAGRSKASSSYKFYGDSQFYKKVIPVETPENEASSAHQGAHFPANKQSTEESDEVAALGVTLLPNLSPEENMNLARTVADISANTTTYVMNHSYKPLHHLVGQRTEPAKVQHVPEQIVSAPSQNRNTTFRQDDEDDDDEDHGHDAPNWSKTRSSVILLSATVLYAIVAEILVDTVDVVLENVQIDEKLLGYLLFALVPNTTEFLNAISFAVNGNIALSMEIGSAYALQVCLLQIPALVAFSAWYNRGQTLDAAYMFNLIFPRWDVVCVILCVFLLSHVYGEGKSNYFKGTILVFSYLVVTLGFFFSPVEVPEVEVYRYRTTKMTPKLGLQIGKDGL